MTAAVPQGTDFMICPNCGWDNLPGNEECSHCGHDLTALDRPRAGDRVEKSLMDDRVAELDPKHPVVAGADTLIPDAIHIMLEKNVGTLLVVDEQGRLIGIFSERDLLKKMAGHAEDVVPSLTVGLFMTEKPETVKTTDTLAFALHKMDVGGYRHLPVVDDGAPLGVISVRDMLHHITKLCKD